MATAQEILSTIHSLEKQLASLKGFMEAHDGALPAGKGKAKKARAPRDPDAPPPKENPYFAFLNGRIRPLLKAAAAEGEKQPGTVPVFFTTHLMSLNPDNKDAVYALTDDEVLAAYRDWATPENLEAAKPARKAKDAGSEAGFETASDGGASEKPAKAKRVLSDEQKAKMKAGREAAKAAKAATAAPAAPAPEPNAVTKTLLAGGPVSGRDIGKVDIAAVAALAPAKAEPKPKFAKKEVKAKAYTLAELQDWNEMEIDGETYGVNKRGDVIDGEGEFKGRWDAASKSIKEAPLPADWAQVMN